MLCTVSSTFKAVWSSVFRAASAFFNETNASDMTGVNACYNERMAGGRGRGTGGLLLEIATLDNILSLILALFCCCSVFCRLRGEKNLAITLRF